MKLVACLSLLVIVIMAEAYPYNARSGLINTQPLIIRGYYMPKHRRSSYFQTPNVMTTYAQGDMFGANSFMDQKPLNYQPEENNVRDEPQEPSASDVDLSANESTEETLKETTEKPKRNRNNKKDDEEEDEYWPFNKDLKGLPSYNAFFPIMIGGYSNGRERGGGYTGTATAIANSFSTGKGGIASSHATAYGDPYLSTLLRNGNGLRKRVKSEEQE